MRWMVGIGVAFVVMILANLALVMAAVEHDDPVVDSYRTEPR